VIAQLLVAWSLMSVCVVIHAVGITIALPNVHGHALLRPQPWRWVWLFSRLAGWIIFLHLLEIAVWGLFFVWRDAMPDMPSALYFSAVTYTTTGYGDLVLPQEWRLLGAIEALTGILMCGWSTGFFFAIVSRIHTDGAEATTRLHNQ
jgi:hypothetical protein